LALAIQAAHDKGIVHRDLKPANILLTSFIDLTDAGDSADSDDLGLPKITDFGLAKYLHEAPAGGPTRSGAVLGTPSYMAPEQAEGHGEHVGAWTDVYALGAILYELLTGRPPFKARTVLETLEQVRSDDPVPPRRLQPKTPRDLETICLKCLQKDPDRRYRRTAGLAEDLRRFLAGESIHARPAGALERVIKWGRRRPTAAALVVLCTLAIAAVSIAIPWHIRRLETEVEQERAKVSALYEEKGRSNLGNECHRTLRTGEEALAGPGPDDWRVALDRFTQVIDRIGVTRAGQDEELDRLRHDAKKLQAQARDRIRASEATHDARARLTRFLQLKEEAFFLLHRDLVTGRGGSDPQESERRAREALEQFGLGKGVDRPSPDPELLSPSEQRQFRDGLQEVSLTLAAALARPRRDEGPGQGRQRAAQALALLNEAARWLPGTTRSVHLHRARYLERCGAKDAAAAERGAADKAALTTSLDWYLAGQEELIHHGDAAIAVQDFDRALDLDPLLFWARFLRALACQQQGRPGEARLGLADCIRLRPKFVWSWLLHGFLSGKAGDAKAAEDDFRHVESAGLLGDNAARYLLHVYRGTLAMEQRQFSRAADQFARAIPLQPGLYHAHALLGQALHQLGDSNRPQLWTEALSLLSYRQKALLQFNEAIRLAPGRADLFRQRAEWRRKSGDLSGARHDLDEAIRLGIWDGARDAKALGEDYRVRAEVLSRQRLNLEALLDCCEAVRLYPKDAESHRVLGELLSQLGCAEGALAALDKCLDLDPRPASRVFWLRAQARADLGDFEGVRREYTRALAVRADPQVYVRRGWAWLLTGALKPAREDFEEALRRDPGLADAHNGLGLVRAQMGEYVQGVADAEQALRSGARSEWLLYNAARVYAQAAGAVSADPRLPPGARQQRQEYEARAVRLLGEALECVPEESRADFWRDKVERDLALVPLALNASFHRLAGQFNPARIQR
jgi:tetratricopeptide (TPR) repeat protein